MSDIPATVSASPHWLCHPPHGFWFIFDAQAEDSASLEAIWEDRKLRRLPRRTPRLSIHSVAFARRGKTLIGFKSTPNEEFEWRG